MYRRPMDTINAEQATAPFVAPHGSMSFTIMADAQNTLMLPDGSTAPSFVAEIDAERWLADYMRKLQDPQPWIKPSTQERYAEDPRSGGFVVYSPRLVWPKCGGRMVRRDYLRPGDKAISSHYGFRTVKSVSQRGTEGQTTTILWEGGTEDLPFQESYDSSSQIELIEGEI